MSNHDELINAFKTLFSNKYFHETGGVTFTPCAEDGDKLTKVEMSLAWGTDETSLEFFCEDVVYTVDQNEGKGSSMLILEPDACLLMGAAMIGFSLSKEKINAERAIERMQRNAKQEPQS